MTVTEYALSITQELNQVMGNTNPEKLDKLLAKIRQAERVFVLGAGRSRLMLMAFAMRLMQIGFKVYVVGEIVTPSIQKGDLLIIGSGSGETASLLLNAKKAKDLGVEIVLISTNEHSSIAQIANTTFVIPTTTKKLGAKSTSVQPGGSTFEQSLLLVGDAIILSLLQTMDPSTNVMTLHANLE